MAIFSGATVAPSCEPWLPETSLPVVSHVKGTLDGFRETTCRAVVIKVGESSEPLPTLLMGLPPTVAISAVT